MSRMASRWFRDPNTSPPPASQAPELPHSLPEVYRSVPVPSRGSWFRKLLAFLGPGYLVAVGYMDPGNWATDLAGGSAFNYTLLSVVVLSSLMAVLLQTLSLRLGIASGRDLAQACREHYSRRVGHMLWGLAEIGIAACDLAEVIGSAIALKLLFGLPMLVGVLLTASDVLIVLALQSRGFRQFEALVIGLVAMIAGCFAVQLAWAHPAWGAVFHGFMPQAAVVTHPAMLYVAVGILGATVMPHNLYLHSAIVQTRAYERTAEGRRAAIRLSTLDSAVALFFAMLVNAAILVLAAATFHHAGRFDVAEIQQAYKLLSPTMGVPLASALFAIALLASGQNSTFTGTLAGQIVMEGFLDLKLPPWMRRLVTRAIAIAPAVLVIALFGEGASGPLLIFSQVVLSMQLSFAVFPLVRFTSDRRLMGEFANATWLKYTSYAVAWLIAGLNAWLIFQAVGSWVHR